MTLCTASASRRCWALGWHYTSSTGSYIASSQIDTTNNRYAERSRYYTTINTTPKVNLGNA